jgi:succinate-semialdehyde dehydrogenase/glutarate-semialdehyde dehydrogenase
MQAINPATGEALKEWQDHSLDDARAMAEAAQRAQRAWRQEPMGERARVLRRAAAELRKRASDLARLMAQEMGKPMRAGAGEVEKCAWACEFYADSGPAMLEDQPVAAGFHKSVVSFQPLGVVLAVMPWNFPLWQVFRFAAPALLGGNAALLKHSSQVPGCAMAIEETLRSAGLPENVFRTALVSGEAALELVKHPAVRAVTLTGGAGAGRAVASAAGAALKKTVLELGGSDAYVVLADADLAQAARVCAAARLVNGGQSCIAAKRFIIEQAVYAEFVDAFAKRLAAVQMGDPLDPTTELGPLASVRLRDELHAQVERSVAQGARLTLGGWVPERVGAWYPPTVLEEVRPGMVAFEEELFGPVAAVIRAESRAHALELANQSEFGLGAAVFTRDRAEGERLAREVLEAGACFVNGFVRSDPRLPFGGIKASGYGRELSSFGLYEFMNVKSVVVA